MVFPAPLGLWGPERFLGGNFNSPPIISRTETTQVCINQKVSFISPPPAEREGRQLGPALGEEEPDPGLWEPRPLGGQGALAEAAQCLEFWPWLKLEEPCSLRMGRVWRLVVETVGEKRRGEKGSGSSAGPTQGEGRAQKCPGPPEALPSREE